VKTSSDLEVPGDSPVVIDAEGADDKDSRLNVLADEWRFKYEGMNP
jgi:hypothetical protein